MSENWVHNINPEWLDARRGYLTASQVSALWPETATGRKRTITDEDYRAFKFAAYEESSLASLTTYGLAARGHVLEPYAIEEYNQVVGEDLLAHHWDDVVIHNQSLGLPVAFSPDGLSIPQTSTNPFQLVEDLDAIHHVYEIKSYAAEKHYKTACLELKAPERIQIATQMYVCPEATTGTLILYNPRLSTGALLYTAWHRQELEHELEVIHEIVQRYHETITFTGMDFRARRGPSEEDILAAHNAMRID